MAGRFRELVTKPLERSKYWRKVRNASIEESPYCANCGKHFKHLAKYRLQVHHIKPFHLFPELELSKDNLINLCGNPRCHLDKGHLGNFRAFNPMVREMCEVFKKLYNERPRTREEDDKVRYIRIVKDAVEGTE